MSLVVTSADAANMFFLACSGSFSLEMHSSIPTETESGVEPLGILGEHIGLEVIWLYVPNRSHSASISEQRLHRPR